MSRYQVIDTETGECMSIADYVRRVVFPALARQAAQQAERGAALSAEELARLLFAREQEDT